MLKIPGGLNLEALHHLKRAFLEHYPDFEALRFQASHGAYWDEERSYKEKVLANAKAVIASQPQNVETVGQAMLDVLQQPPANFVGWRAFAQIKDAGSEGQKAAAIAIGEMLTASGDISTLAAECATKLHPILSSGNVGKPAFGNVRTIVSTALALTRPQDAIAVKTEFMQRAAKLLIGRRLFKSAVMTREEYRDDHLVVKVCGDGVGQVSQGRKAIAPQGGVNRSATSP
jgi:5-methylcytosine-specific restriction enzyme B